MHYVQQSDTMIDSEMLVSRSTARFYAHLSQKETGRNRNITYQYTYTSLVRVVARHSEIMWTMRYECVHCVPNATRSFFAQRFA